jgi:hypothetical protein
MADSSIPAKVYDNLVLTLKPILLAVLILIDFC